MCKKAVSALLAVLMLTLVLAGCAAGAKDADKASESLLQKADEVLGAEDTDKPAKTAKPAAEETDEAEATQEPEETAKPEATDEPADNPLLYTDSRFGFTLEFPKSWEGKYRIHQYDQGIVVYFAPSTPIEDGKGKFFAMIVNPAEDEMDYYDNPQIITTSKARYLYGGPTDVTYMETDPEYDTFVRMNKDIDAIMNTLKD